MKRLLCFFDGTWNTPDSPDERTNVVKLHQAVPAVAVDGRRQLAHYVIGIATTEVPDRLKFAVGAIGHGVAERIKTGYAFLMQHYEPGDEIYIFGFSRGAFQARSLGGLLALIGLLKANASDRVDEAWQYYQSSRASPDPGRLADLHSVSHHGVRIRCIGVWDTVGNLGVPLIPKILDSRELTFRNTELSGQVDVGLHALSIDEPRGPFSPTLWTKKAGSPLPAGQVIEQVWFPGCHANVGGGYPDASLSDISLIWMAERASKLTGVTFDLDKLRRETRPDPLGEAVSPTSDAIFRVSAVLPYIRLLGQDKRGIAPWRRALFAGWRTSALPPGEVVVNETIHDSAYARFGQRVKLRQGSEIRTVRYRPRSLKFALRTIKDKAT